jgi:hypothetical protein
MPDYRQHKVDSLMALLGQGMQSGMQAGSAGAQQAMKGNHELEQEKLKDFLLSGQKKQDTAAVLDALQGGQLPEGSGFKQGDAAATRGFNLAGAASKQSHDFDKNVTGKLAPLNSQMDSAEQALSQLGLGTEQGYKQALMAEVALALKGAGGRAFGQAMKALDPTGSLGSDLTKWEGYFSGHPELLKASSPLINSLKQSIFARNGQLGQQVDALGNEFNKTGPDQAPYNYGNVISAHMDPVRSRFSKLQQMQSDFDKASAAASPSAQVLSGQQPPGQALGATVRQGIGNAATGLGGFLKGLAGGSAPSPQAPAAAPPGALKIDPNDQALIDAAKSDPSHPKAGQVLKDMQAKYPGAQF